MLAFRSSAVRGYCVRPSGSLMHCSHRACKYCSPAQCIPVFPTASSTLSKPEVFSILRSAACQCNLCDKANVDLPITSDFLIEPPTKPALHGPRPPIYLSLTLWNKPPDHEPRRARLAKFRRLPNILAKAYLPGNAVNTYYCNHSQMSWMHTPSQGNVMQSSRAAIGVTSTSVISPSMSGGQSNTITGSAILTTGGSGDLDTTDTDPSSNITITLVISNLHCSSCATTIHLLLAPLTPPPTAISTNIVTHEVTIEHVAALSTNEILRVLLEAGFKVDSITVSGVCVTPSPHTGGLWGGRVTSINNIHTLTYENLPPEDWGESIKIALQSGKSHERHVEVCEVCRSKEHKRASGTPLSPSSGTPQWGNAVSNASVLFMDRPGGGSADSAGESSKSPGYGGAADEKSLIHYADASYSAPATPSNMFEKGQTSPLSPRSTSNIAPHNTSSTEPRSAMASPERPAALQTEVVFPVAVTEMQVPDIILNVAPATALFEATFSIEGMTCSACTGKVNDTVGHLPGVKSVNVALMTNSATIEFEGVKEDAAKIVDEIEDIGYGCMLESIKELNSDGAQTKIVERVVQIRIEGMFCESCPTRVIEALQTFGDAIKVGKPLTIPDPIVQISYLAAPPDFTIRHIISTLNAVDPAFSASIYQPPTIEERSRHIQRTELRRLILRAILCIIIAIPTFLIGIVWMSLVPKNDRMRRYFAKQMWAGQVTRLEWALFFLSTPVQFFVADVFHVRAYKEIKALWRPGSQVPILRRFYRFGSMNLLISLGVSIAYFASVGLLATAATRKGESKGPHTTYFDSTVFLTMFLLIGRCLEAYSKIKTSDAVSMLGKLRPTEALLLEPEGPPATPHSASTGSLATKEHASPTVNKIPVDMLEVGDTIIVQHGGSPPADGKLSQGETKFDESSLTGEARPVQKKEGDVVFAGTINKGKAVRVVVDAVSGESMLDQIVKVVREGQTRRAPIERVADMLTGYFVPVVTLIAISTWVIWLSLGMSGVLPDYWLDVDEGSWPVWSLGFAIAVFVVACPCGIGLAAPTALFVGSGLAAKYGILAKGGGEAFQEASWLDVVVFDKTGTLTEGGEPKVTDEEVFVDTVGRDEEGVLGLELEVRKLVYAFAIGLEEMSSHPLARAVVSHCEPQERANVTGSDVEEVPGRGLRGVFTINNTSDSYEAIIGNEAFMTENGVAELKDVTSSLLHSWKSRGKSVVLFAIKPRPNTTTLPCFTQETFTLTAAFAAADPLRSEAPYVVKNLRASGISVWMISGDNPVTATAVADMVGIPRENVIAGVLPTQKAEKIQYLQTYAPKRRRRTWYGKTKAANPRAIVAMVGDGINDAPALAVSDVGVAIGSGSDVAIGSAKFILVSSNLCSLFTLIELSRKVFRRVKFNFFWACVYNLIALPVAAGVLYPVGMREYNAPSAVQSHGVSHNGIQMNMDGDGPRRIRLEPVWASLAMALSSVSVVCSSLLLRTKWYGVGFRPSMMAMKASPGEDPEEQRDINIDEVV